MVSNSQTAVVDLSPLSEALQTTSSSEVMKVLEEIRGRQFSPLPTSKISRWYFESDDLYHPGANQMLKKSSPALLKNCAN